MKMYKAKLMMISCLAIIMITGGSVFAGHNKSFRQEKNAVSRDLTRIDQKQASIKYLKAQHKEERAAGIKGSKTCSEIMKAKADLKREKAYLKADKAALFMEHQSAINSHKADVKRDKADLRVAKKELHKELAQGNELAANQHVRTIINYKQDVRQDEAALREAKINRNAELLAVNRDIKESKGQSAVALSFENSMVKMQNLAMK